MGSGGHGGNWPNLAFYELFQLSISFGHIVNLILTFLPFIDFSWNFTPKSQIGPYLNNEQSKSNEILVDN